MPPEMPDWASGNRQARFLISVVERTRLPGTPDPNAQRLTPNAFNPSELTRASKRRKVKSGNEGPVYSPAFPVS